LSNAAHDAPLLAGGTGAGGGIAVVGGGPVIRDTTIRQNHASSFCAGYGGGISFVDSDSSALTRCVLEANVGSVDAHGYGGALNLKRSSPEISTCAFVLNLSGTHSASTGSALAAYASASSVSYCTFSGNAGGDGVAIHLDEATSIESAVTIANSILAGSATGITTTPGSTATVSRILWHEVGTTASADVTVSDELFGDPLFAFDGYHLQSGSAAIDAGQASTDIDIDGEPRDSGPASDWAPTNSRPDLGTSAPVAARSPPCYNDVLGRLQSKGIRL
jgi:hypothetical protein